MKTTLFLLAFAVGVIAGPATRATYINIPNSYGCDSLALAVWRDTVRIDTNCDYTTDKLALGDTGRGIWIEPYASTTFLAKITSAETTTDSVTFYQGIECYDIGLRSWMSNNTWRATGADSVDTAYTVIYSTTGAQAKEMNFSTCDSVRFLTAPLDLSSHGDTISIITRKIRGK
jgi:hypothetical protein